MVRGPPPRYRPRDLRAGAALVRRETPTRRATRDLLLRPVPSRRGGDIRGSAARRHRDRAVAARGDARSPRRPLEASAHLAALLGRAPVLRAHASDARPDEEAP